MTRKGLAHALVRVILCIYQLDASQAKKRGKMIDVQRNPNSATYASAPYATATIPSVATSATCGKRLPPVVM